MYYFLPFQSKIVRLDNLRIIQGFGEEEIYLRIYTYLQFTCSVRGPAGARSFSVGGLCYFGSGCRPVVGVGRGTTALTVAVAALAAPALSTALRKPCFRVGWPPRGGLVPRAHGIFCIPVARSFCPGSWFVSLVVFHVFVLR